MPARRERERERGNFGSGGWGARERGREKEEEKKKFDHTLLHTLNNVPPAASRMSTGQPAPRVERENQHLFCKTP